MGALLDRFDVTIAGLFRFASQTTTRSLALIALLASLIAFPGLQSLPVTDRDEARYVQASKQMMETGDYIDIRNLDEPRWKKPVGIYWLQVASAKLVGDGAESRIWAYRVPSAVAIVIAAMLTYWALLPLLGTTPALIAGLVTASTATTAVEAHIAKTDAVLLAFTVLAFSGFVRVYLARSSGFSRAHLLLWAGLGLGFLTKGPIILIPLIGALLWIMIAERSLSILRAIAPLKGFLLFLAIAAPWYIAIAIKTDGAFFAESLGKDLLGKVGQASEKHGGPFGYYLATMWVTFWPWMPLALLALPLAWANRSSAQATLFASWIIPCWAVFAFTSTKLPHYILPALPAIAGLIGFGFAQSSEKALRALATFLFVAGGVGAGFFALAPLPVIEHEFPFSLILMSVLILTSFLLAAVSLATGRINAFAGLGAATLLIMFPTLTMISAPQTDRLFISPRMVAAHRIYENCADRPIASHGYTEMSLAFLGGTDTRFVSLEEAAELLAKPEGGWRVFVRLDGTGEMIPKLSEMSGQLLEALSVVEGTNYNSGKDVTIALVAAATDPSLNTCRP